jgi:putative ABC transport system permease protein
MKNYNFLYIILKDIKSRMFSSFLTFLSISFGILSIFSILVLGESFEKSVGEEFEKMGTNKIFLNPEVQSINKYFNDNLIKDLLKIKGIETINPLNSKRLEISKKQNNNVFSKNIIGIEFSKKSFSDFSLSVEFGKAPIKSNKYGVYIGNLINREYFDNKLSVGSSIYIKNTRFKVSGILKKIGSERDDKQIYISIETLKKLTNSEIYNTLIINTNKKLNLHNIKFELEKFLKKKYSKESDFFSILLLEESIEQFNNIVGIIQKVFLGIGIISLIVGFLGILNTMYVIVSSKFKDIGIMKSVGATNKEILLLFSILSGTYGLLGALLGVGVGVLIFSVLGDIGSKLGLSFFKITINYLYVIFMIFFGFIIGIIAGFLPSYKASKLNIIEALRK